MTSGSRYSWTRPRGVGVPRCNTICFNLGTTWGIVHLFGCELAARSITISKAVKTRRAVCGRQHRRCGMPHTRMWLYHSAWRCIRGWPRFLNLGVRRTQEGHLENEETMTRDLPTAKPPPFKNRGHPALPVIVPRLVDQGFLGHFIKPPFSRTTIVGPFWASQPASVAWNERFTPVPRRASVALISACYNASEERRLTVFCNGVNWPSVSTRFMEGQWPPPP